MDDVHDSVKNEIDEQLQQRLLGSASNGRGFALDVAKVVEGDKPTVRFEVSQVKPVHDEWQRPAPYRCPTVENVESLVAYANKHGSKEKSVIFYNDESVLLVLDDRVERGERENARLQWAYSAEWNAWDALVNRGAKPTHRELLEFVIRWQHTLRDVQIINSMREVKATAQVSLDSDLRLDAETAGVTFKATAGESLVKFPRKFSLSLPVLDIHVDDALTWVNVDVRLEVIMPTKPDVPVMFQFFASDWHAIRRRMVNDEISVLRASLPDFLCVRGKGNWQERKLG